jgi:hypothetical protein
MGNGDRMNLKARREESKEGEEEKEVVVVEFEVLAGQEKTGLISFLRANCVVCAN